MDQINILVVDDEKEIADLVEIYLVSDGYKEFKANNALDGLELIEKEDIQQYSDHYGQCEIDGSG